jgi:hypothetical protein
MTTPEGKVKDQVKKLLKRFACIYYHMPVQNGMGAPSLDFICCVRGYYLAIETKAPGKKPTPRQELTIAAITQAMGFVFVVAGDEDLLRLEAFLDLFASMDADQLTAHVALHK